MSEPTLSHDIEEWIKDHSHAGLWDRTVDQGRAIDELEDRVASLEDAIAEMSGECPHMEPRGPHD